MVPHYMIMVSTFTGANLPVRACDFEWPVSTMNGQISSVKLLKNIIFCDFRSIQLCHVA